MVVLSPNTSVSCLGAVGIWAIMVGCGGASKPPNLNDSNLVRDAGGSGSGGGSGTDRTPDADGSPDPNDPFGSCIVGTSAPPEWPFICTNGHSLCIGGTDGSHCDGGSCEPLVYHVICENRCDADSECPIPSTGTSRPSCQPESHVCQLPCSRDADCPIGSTCQDGRPWMPLDSAGNPLGLPHMCMLTLSVDAPGPDGGP
jgi:hypothetical protein